MRFISCHTFRYNFVYTSFCCGFNSQYNTKIDTSCKLLLLHFFLPFSSIFTYTYFWYRKARIFFLLLQVTLMLLCQIFSLWKNLFLFCSKISIKKEVNYWIQESPFFTLLCVPWYVLNFISTFYIHSVLFIFVYFFN